MHYTKLMGIAAPELTWVPSPSYILRRAAVLDWLRNYPPGKVLEIGCGPGALLRDLSEKGFGGTGVELSDQSRIIFQQMLADIPQMKVVDNLGELNEATYDYLLAFEVLEHIENDIVALRDWLKYLKPGGMVFLSVPAHRSRWNVTDLSAGHFRRYDKADAVDMIQCADLRLARIGTCGWPVSRVFELLRVRAKEKELRRDGVDPDKLSIGDLESTKSSGVDRALVTRLYRFYGGWMGKLFFLLATKLQKLFYGTSLGISFLIIATKPELPE